MGRGQSKNRLAVGLVVLLMLSLPPVHLEAQVPGRGALSVEIIDRDGFPLQGVQALLTAVDSDGGGREIITSSTGLANFFFVPAGSWSLLVERLGYVPVRVRGVEVVPGERDRLRITLREASPPVTEIDDFRYFELVEQHHASGMRLLRGGAHRLPGADAGFLTLLETAAATPTLPSRLPLRYLQVEADGIPFNPAGLPITGPGFEGLGALSPSHLRRMGIYRSSPLIGGPDGPGPLLDLSGRGGGDRVRGRVGAGGQWVESGSGGEIAPWFSGHISGPLMGDTLTMSVGLSYERSQTSVPGLLATGESDPEALLASFGSEMEGLPEQVRSLRSLDILSGHARMDWAIGDFSSLMFQAFGSMIPEMDPLFTPPLPEHHSPVSSGSDLFTSSRFLYATDEGTAIEVSLGFGRSGRVMGSGMSADAAAGAGYAFAEEGVFLGSFRDLSGEFSLSTVSFSPVATISGDRFRIRGGAQAIFRGWSDQRISRLDRRVLGRRVAISGAQPTLIRGLELSSRDLTIRQRQIGLFGEFRWWPSEDLRFTGELRVDREFLPLGAFQSSSILEDLSGIDRRSVDEEPTRLSPSGELQWTPSALPGWSITARGEMQPGWTDPALLGEIIREGGGTTGIREFGSAGRFEGYQPHLLGPAFEPPRGELLSLRAEGALAPSLSVGVELFRHRTEFLPRRRDLNLSPGSGTVDQFGRSHVGELVEVDGIIGIRPGSDRRFPEFHEIWAFEADGWVQTLGASVGVTVEFDAMTVEANYTRSETRDNMPFGLTGWSNPTSGFLGPDSRQASWVEGRSDQDRPHMLNLLGTIDIPAVPGSRVSWRYQLSSGRPFTPGVRDALGWEWEEGWTRLQPIALPDGSTLPSGGSGWSCALETGASGRLERNVCRGEVVQRIDLRLDLSLPSLGGRDLALRVDALNLLDQVEHLRDPALMKVEGSGVLPTASANARITLPAVGNPTFGEPLARLPGGRSLRFGLEYRF